MVWMFHHCLSSWYECFTIVYPHGMPCLVPPLASTHCFPPPPPSFPSTGTRTLQLLHQTIDSLETVLSLSLPPLPPFLLSPPPPSLTLSSLCLSVCLSLSPCVQCWEPVLENMEYKREVASLIVTQSTFKLSCHCDARRRSFVLKSLNKKTELLGILKML